MHLYLDVDGTILRRAGHARLRGDFAPALHLTRFLTWAAGRFACAWVSSRTRHGGADLLLPVLRQAIGPGEEWDRIRGLVAGFATPRWDHVKAQAMALDHDFLWLDDAPEEDSLTMLDRHGKRSAWIAVDVDRRPDDLIRVMALVDGRGQGRAAE